MHLFRERKDVMNGGFVLPTVLVTTTIIVSIVSVQIFNSITSDRSSRSKLFTILNDSASESIFYSYRSLLIQYEPNI